jgi:hypothetical protein
MTDPKILERFGCTPERLQKLFTADMPAETPAQVSMDASQPPPDDKRPKNDGQRRRAWEAKIRSRMYDGVGANLRAARPNQAVDLAWDAPPIQRHTIPLLLWAQGKLKIESAYAQCVATSSAETADRLFRKTKSNGKDTIGLNTTRITDISIDLLKSYVTRRHAAMDALWSNLWPLFKYDPRGTDDVAMLRADALSQRVDIIADSYNYRHFFSQCRRQMLLYGWSMAISRAAWDRQISWRYKPTNTGEPSEEIESYVTREGVDFVNPHPSRIWYDLSSPLANINTDTGPSFLGYWDIVRWGSLLGPSAPFYNLDHVFITDTWVQMVGMYPDFFPYYFDPCVLNWPNYGGVDPAAANGRDVQIGSYSSQAKDVGVLLTHYFEKINPKVEGIGDYDADVWIHLTVAGDCTVVAGEFLPSIPGCYGGVNWNDGRMANQSMGMALLSYQDQCSNIISSMLMQLRTSLIQLWLLDKDSLDPEILQSFKDNGADGDWWVDRKLLIYSASKLRDLGILDPRQAFAVVQAQVQNVFDAGMKALTQLLNLADRLLILSPNELGQPNPREVSAREVSDIATSVQAMYAFINQGPREQIAAAKELVYDSLICHATQNFRVPITQRYTPDVVERAGFKIPSDVKLDEDADIPANTPIMGNLQNLIFDVYFDSRDGAERVQNTQGATVVMQLLQSLIQIPGLAEKMGLRNIMDAANIVIRMSGAPWNFQFQIPQGGDDSVPAEPEGAAPDPAAQQQSMQMAQMIQQLGVGQQRLEQLLMQFLQGGGAAPAASGGAPVAPVARLQDPALAAA